MERSDGGYFVVEVFLPVFSIASSVKDPVEVLRKHLYK